MYTLEQIKPDINLTWDSGDKWGSAMMLFFDCASELYARGADIPPEWGYSPGLCDDPREEESYFYDIFKETEIDSLIRLGNILNRLCNIYKAQGLDY